MIFFVIFFLLTLAFSIYLAYRSMRGVYDLPEGGVNGLFLIRKPQNLTEKTLIGFQKATQKSGQIISLERLFKGSKSALVILGPKKLLLEFDLDLLELEDYTKVEGKKVSAWEIKKPLSFEKLNLSGDDQLWLQFVIQAQKNGFILQMRVVLVTSSAERKHQDSTEAYLRFTQRRIAPLGKKASKVSAKELADIILPLPQ